MLKVLEKVKQKVTVANQKGAFHVVCGSFLTKFVSFFGSVFLVRVLSKSDYGVLGYYENFYGYFLVFYGLGLQSGLQRYMILADNVSAKLGCFKYAIKRATVWNLFLSVCCALFLFFYPHPVAFAGHYLIICCLSACLVFAFFNEASFSAMRAFFDNKHFAVLSFCTATALIVFRVLGAYARGMNGSVVGRLLAEVICGLGCLTFVFRHFFSDVVAEQPSYDFKQGLNVFSAQIMLTNGLWAVFMLNDMFLLGQLCGSETLIADYKIAYVIPANLAILTSSIGIFVSPYFTKYDNEKNYAWIRKNFALTLEVTCLIMAIAVVVCYTLAKPIILLLFGKKYLSAIPIMKVLLIAAFCTNGVRYPIANILSSMGQQKINLVVAAIGVGLQVSLDIIFIPKYGALGVAWTSAAVYSIMAVCLLSVFWKKYYEAS